MNIIKWTVRIVFLWFPIVGATICLFFGGVVWPMFFGDGLDGIAAFFSIPKNVLLIKQIAIAMVINFIYSRLWNVIERIYNAVVGFMLRVVDAAYDKLFGGPYGRGMSTLMVWMNIAVRIFCFCIWAFILFYVMAYLIYDGLVHMSWSWAAWMKWKYAERVTYRWFPLTVFLLVFTEPLLHVIDRPVRGVIERAAGCFNNKKQNTQEVTAEDE